MRNVVAAKPSGAQDTKLEIPTMVDAVVQRLRALVVSGQMRPGDRLIEERLSEMLGVSRPPLREALRMLERDGLVQSLPRRGFRVVPITAEDVREIYSLRFTLERLAVELGVPVNEPARLQPMREALAEMKVAVDAADDEGILSANSTFHLALVDISGHSRLLAAYDRLRLQFEVCMAYNLRFREEMYGDRADVHPRHEALLETIEAGNRRAVLYQIAHHGNRSFLENLDDLLDPVKP